METRHRPLIAIAGRPNVGKSTLYNRLVGGRPALVHNSPGLTRDRRYGEFDYFGHEFRVVDTGGLDPEAERDAIGAGIHRQARAALTECDAVLFVVDATDGVTALDRHVAELLRTVDKPIVVCANKVDSHKRDILATEMYDLGLDVFAISAVHGRGVDALLEYLVERLDLPPVQHEAPDDDAFDDDAFADDDADDAPTDDEDRRAAEIAARDAEIAARPLRVAFVGKPNAGKSSLVNRLIGVERSLVHDQPGTTTDPVDIPFEFGGRSYRLVDTAGIRRKSRIDAPTEKLSVSLAIGQIERADVVVLVIDSALGPSEQDARLAGAVEQRGRGLIIALNKSDLIRDPEANRALRRNTRDELHFVTYAPVAPLSALRGDGVEALMNAIDRAAVQYRRRITTAELNRFFAEVCEHHPPPIYRGRSVRIQYITQGGIQPPTFLLWANRPDGISPAYRRYVRNQLRARYRFEGTPVRLFIKAKKRSKSKARGKSSRRSRRSR